MYHGLVRALIASVAVCALHLNAQDNLEPQIDPDDVLNWHGTGATDRSEPAPVNVPAESPPAEAARGVVAPAAHQATGALSGRIVFMNSGHGWTSRNPTNGDPAYWDLQRGIALNSMNEDYGNLDQLNFFASYCFNAGAVVASMRPLGQQTNEVVLDNDDAGVTYAGSWSDSSATYYFGSPGDVPYRFASFAATETATATYTPNIPVAGYYPIYCWTRAGSDRGDQLYRIRHTGGESQLRIPHHMVGNGWIYLGEYYFNAGANSANGSVVISNLRGTATGTVVIADAIRFGNGMGSVDRGVGPSGYPREEENCRYWIQSNLGQGQLTSLYEGSGTDEQDSWSAPGKMSAEMNREAFGSIYKRIHISFHSNAGSGSSRGCEGLITPNNTPNQAELARLCGQTVNDELVDLGSPPMEYAWYDRGTNITYFSPTGYGEITDTYFNGEMDATIIEVAYHDNTNDAALMRDAKVRDAIARAAMHAVVKYMNEFDGVPLIYLPEPPTNPRAFGNTNGSITLAWAPPVSVAGSGAPTNYFIYRSTNGYGFGNAIAVGNVTNYTITNLTAGTDYYFRITAANEGGESFSAEVVGCRTPLYAGAPRILFVNANDRYDRTTNLKQDLVAQTYDPPGPTGGNERVLPRRVNSFDYVVQHGKAISAYGMAFDSCQNEAVASGFITLTNYHIVIWACGNESTADESFNATEQTKVAAFLAAGGHLFTSGSEIAWDLDRTSGPTTADRNFLHNQLHATYAADSSGFWNFTASGSSIFAGNTNGSFDDGTKGLYLVGFPDVVTPTGSGATNAISYIGGPAGAAGIVYNGPAGTGRVVYLSFPFETITSEAVRNAYMADILGLFRANIPFLPLKFDSVTPWAGNQLKLTLSGEPGLYTLQTSSNLTSWISVTNLTNTTSSFEFIDPNPTDQPAKYYRAKSSP